MARGDCNITNICIPTRRIIYSAGFTPPAPPPPPPECNFPSGTFAQGGAICDWEYRVRWDIDPTQVPSTQSNYLAFISLDELVSDLSPGDNAIFWNHASRANIRVSRADGVTELPHYTSAIDNINETGYLWTRIPSVSDSITTSLFVYFSNPAATEYAVTDPMGRNAVFQDYRAFYDFEQDPVISDATDLTGNGNTGVRGSTGGVGTITKTATGPVGSEWVFQNQRYLNCGYMNPGAADMTLGGWVKIPTGNPQRRSMFGGVAARPTDRYGLFQEQSDGRTQYFLATDTSYVVNGTVIRDGTFNSQTMTVQRSVVNGIKGYANGALDAQGFTPNAVAISDDPLFLIGAITDATGDAILTSISTIFGDVGLIWFKLTADSADRIATEYNNQNTPATFATFTNFQNNGI